MEKSGTDGNLAAVDQYAANILIRKPEGGQNWVQTTGRSDEGSRVSSEYSDAFLGMRRLQEKRGIAEPAGLGGLRRSRFRQSIRRKSSLQGQRILHGLQR